MPVLFYSVIALLFFFFFFNDTATTEIYTLSLHDALPISPAVGVETTLRHPAGPSRGPSSTLAPSALAWSVAAPISRTSTYGSQSGRAVGHSTMPPPKPRASAIARYEPLRAST